MAALSVAPSFCPSVLHGNSKYKQSKMFPFAFSMLFLVFCYSGWSQIVQVILRTLLRYKLLIKYRRLAVLRETAQRLRVHRVDLSAISGFLVAIVIHFLIYLTAIFCGTNCLLCCHAVTHAHIHSLLQSCRQTSLLDRFALACLERP